MNMISIEEIKTLASLELQNSLPGKEEGVVFKVESGDTLNGEPTEDEPFASIEYDIIFELGNCKHRHSIIVGWNEEDGVGLEYGEDGELQSITRASVISSLYYDLALKGLDDKYCQ